MLIRDLTIENFRKFRGIVRLGGFTDGLNLVCEPNETGKSTILEALRAAFFERHGAKSERIKSFRPHGDEVAPTVELTFEAGGGAWTLRKKFLQSPSVSLAGATQRFQSDEAEEKLQSLLGFVRAGPRGADDASRGALGLLWVEQGQSFQAVTPGDTARRTLEELLAGEVGAVTGGKRTSAVIQSVEKALGQLLTKTGRPTGVLQDALTQAAAAEANLAAATAELERFEQLLQQLGARRGELRRVERDLDDGGHHVLITQLRFDYDRARLAAEQLNSATLKEQAARGERERAADRHSRRQADRRTLALAGNSLATASTMSNDAFAELNAAKHAEEALAAVVVQSREALVEADTAYAISIEARLAADQARALTAAFARLDRATKLDRQLSALDDEFRRNLMDEAAMAQIEALDRRLLKAQTVVAPGVTHLDVRLDTGAPSVKLNGVPVSADGRVKLGGPTELLIAGAGRFIITPPVHTEAAAAADLKAAEEDLAASLARLGQTDGTACRAPPRRRPGRSQKWPCPASGRMSSRCGLEYRRRAGNAARRSFGDGATRRRGHQP